MTSMGAAVRVIRDTVVSKVHPYAAPNLVALKAKQSKVEEIEVRVVGLVREI
jgi:hypothetical protein